MRVGEGYLEVVSCQNGVDGVIVGHFEHDLSDMRFEEVAATEVGAPEFDTPRWSLRIRGGRRRAIRECWLRHRGTLGAQFWAFGWLAVRRTGRVGAALASSICCESNWIFAGQSLQAKASWKQLVECGHEKDL
ncbi:uncharacterized protein [Physcomitrium patens]|uniref:uncharacterized protein n=1 Tax=Physcomitrium patens TaxID=3218 RepID=UPI003CCCC089